MTEYFAKNCEMKKNDEFGRYLVAPKPIKPGEILFYELPILVVPHYDDELLCTNCFRASEMICQKCNIFPLCMNCKSHCQFDCEFFNEKMISKNFLIENFSIYALLKCLLFIENSKNAEQIEEFLKLESHLNARRGTDVWQHLDDSVVKKLQNLGIDRLLKKSKIIESDALQNICGILDVNSFEIRRPEANKSLRGIYLNAALMTHSCIANTTIAVDENNQMKIYATTSIQKGEVIYYNYTNPLMGTQQRQENLKLGKYFVCHCRRCEDPTELGSYMSAIKCQSCSNGYQLKNKDIWICDNCSAILDECAVQQLLSKANDEIIAAENDLRDLEMLLERYEKIFHSNHWLVIDLKQNIASILRAICNDPMLRPGIAVYQRKLQLCGDILSVLRVIQFGISRWIGIALYEYVCPLIEITKRNLMKLTNENYLIELKRAEEILKESATMLLYEPANTPEGILTKNILRELKDLRDLIKKIQK